MKSKLHTVTLSRIDRRTANIAAGGPLVYAETYHQDGTVTLVGQFSDLDRANAWRDEFTVIAPTRPAIEESDELESKID